MKLRANFNMPQGNLLDGIPCIELRDKVGEITMCGVPNSYLEELYRREQLVYEEFDRRGIADHFSTWQRTVRQSPFSYISGGGGSTLRFNCINHEQTVLAVGSLEEQVKRLDRDCKTIKKLLIEKGVAINSDDKLGVASGRFYTCTTVGSGTTFYLVDASRKSEAIKIISDVVGGVIKVYGMELDLSIEENRPPVTTPGEVLFNVPCTDETSCVFSCRNENYPAVLGLKGLVHDGQPKFTAYTNGYYGDLLPTRTDNILNQFSSIYHMPLTKQEFETSVQEKLDTFCGSSVLIGNPLTFEGTRFGADVWSWISRGPGMDKFDAIFELDYNDPPELPDSQHLILNGVFQRIRGTFNLTNCYEILAKGLADNVGTSDWTRLIRSLQGCDQLLKSCYYNPPVDGPGYLCTGLTGRDRIASLINDTTQFDERTINGIRMLDFDTLDEGSYSIIINPVRENVLTRRDVTIEDGLLDATMKREDVYIEIVATRIVSDVPAAEDEYEVRAHYRETYSVVPFGYISELLNNPHCELNREVEPYGFEEAQRSLTDVTDDPKPSHMSNFSDEDMFQMNPHRYTDRDGFPNLLGLQPEYKRKLLINYLARCSNFVRNLVHLSYFGAPTFIKPTSYASGSAFADSTALPYNPPVVPYMPYEASVCITDSGSIGEVPPEVIDPPLVEDDGLIECRIFQSFAYFEQGNFRSGWVEPLSELKIEPGSTVRVRVFLLGGYKDDIYPRIFTKDESVKPIIVGINDQPFMESVTYYVGYEFTATLTEDIDFQVNARQATDPAVYNAVDVSVPSVAQIDSNGEIGDVIVCDGIEFLTPQFTYGT